MRKLLLSGPAMALLLGLASPAQAAWITSWTAAPVTPMVAMGPFPATPSYSNRTLRQTLRLSAGGSALRIRFTNAYGKQPLRIGAARVAILDAGGKEVAGSSHMIHFAGSATGVVAKGAALVSDTVNVKLPPLSRISVSLYLPGDTGPCTCHSTGMDETDISAPGDHSAAPFRPESTSPARAFISGVEVDEPHGGHTVVVLGDSISDGIGSTSGANRRWPDFLAARLVARGGAPWGVANEGISGNRVLQGGFGESALARLDRDVLTVPGVSAMILFEGINDIGLSYGHMSGPMAAGMAGFAGRKIDAADIIAGYRQIVKRAHARGIKVYGATITPYKGASTWTPEGEKARETVNTYIRTGHLFDAVLDFDKVFRDPADPESIRADYHMGDHLHGNDASYRAAAASIDLNLFKP